MGAYVQRFGAGVDAASFRCRPGASAVLGPIAWLRPRRGRIAGARDSRGRTAAVAEQRSASSMPAAIGPGIHAPNGDLDLDEVDDPLMALNGSMQMPDDYRERSANLYADPKLRELKHYTRSHQHERRLRASAGFAPRPKTTSLAGASPSMLLPGSALSDASPASLRYEGRGQMDRHMKRLAYARAVPPEGKLPSIGGRPLPPEEVMAQVGADMDAQKEDAKSVQTRLHWRAHMDSAVKSLLVDLELARDARLKEYSHQARCDHLDKIYDWYLMHGMKEVRKERETPPHLRYSEDSPVMPGSLRVRPHTSIGSASHSASSPSLPSVGAAHLGMDSVVAVLAGSASSSRSPSKPGRRGI